MIQAQDVSDAEVRKIPLPQGWKFVVDGSLPKYTSSDGQISTEHPLVAQATDISKKNPLDHGWVIHQNTPAHGETEYFYFNTISNISCWDPPSFRYCLSDLMKKNGFDREANAILKPNDILNLLPVEAPKKEWLQGNWDLCLVLPIYGQDMVILMTQ